MYTTLSRDSSCFLDVFSGTSRSQYVPRSINPGRTIISSHLNIVSRLAYHAGERFPKGEMDKVRCNPQMESHFRSNSSTASLFIFNDWCGVMTLNTR